MIKKKLHLPVPGVDIFVYVVDNVTLHRNKYIFKRWPLLGKLENTENVLALCTHDESHYLGKVWLTFPEAPTIDIIAHELVHAIDAISDTYGFEDTEFRAYLMSWLICEVIPMFPEK